MRDIKEKIASTKQTRKITKAMQMVSAAKLNRAQDHAQSYSIYTDKLHEVVAEIAAGNQGGLKHPMLASRPVKRTGYIVVTADRGLAGAYNNNILKYVHDLIQERHESNDEFTVIVTGKVGLRFFEKRGYPVAFHKVALPDDLAFDDVIDLAKKSVGLFADEDIDELHLIYNHFVNAMTQRLTDTQLLPLTNIESDSAKSVNYEYEPDSEEVLKRLLPLYAEGLIYGALLDAKAAEHAARMTAMRSSTDNASEIIDQLTLSYNRARQAHITQEITEIIGGAAALE